MPSEHEALGRLNTTALLTELEKLRREHGYFAVADGYFATCNDTGTGCHCGADASNARLDRCMEAVREMEKILQVLEVQGPLYINQYGEQACIYCGTYYSDEDGMKHDPTCLWLSILAALAPFKESE